VRGAFVVGILYVAGIAPAIHAKAITPAAAPETALNGGASYIGEAVCIACHAAQNKQFTHTLHANVFRLNPKGEKEKLSCEACHGPGGAHFRQAGSGAAGRGRAGISPCRSPARGH